MTLSTESNSTDEWHAWRAKGIGGSDIAAICGLSTFGSPFSTYLVKRGEIPEDDLSESTVVQFGKRLEPIIPDWFHERTGLYIIGEQTLCEHPENPVHRCTIDGFVAEGTSSFVEDAIGVAEIKVTGDSEKDWADQIPDKYAIQGQWQLHVTGHQHLWFPVIHRHNGAFHVYTLDRDDRVIAELVRIADEFWARVEASDPPPVDGHPATTDALKHAYPDSFDDGVDLPAHLVEDRAVLKGRIAAAEAELAVVENEIKATLGECAFGDVNGERLVSWKTQTAERIDTKRLRAEYPDVADAVTKESRSRVLRVKNPTKEK